MSSKSRKSLSSWIKCEKCQCVLVQKDMPMHEDNCPPLLDNWNHNFILNGTLYSTVETYTAQELPKHISERDLNDMVFVSQSALELCNITIGAPVIVASKNCTIVKTAWPTFDKSLTSISLTKAVIELNSVEGSIKLHSLNSTVNIAKEFVVRYIGKHSMLDTTAEIDIIFKNYNEQKIFCVGNKISIPYYGKKLIYRIVKVRADNHDKPRESKSTDELEKDLDRLHLNTSETERVKYYKSIYSTRWIVVNDTPNVATERRRVKYKIEDIGGYDNLIADIKDVLDIGLGKCRSIGNFNIGKGILLHGNPGVGKSMIANALASEYNINTFNVNSSDIYSKSIGETEKRLREIFVEAKINTPSIILVEDIDSLCPKRSSSTTDHERRVLVQLITLFDELQNTEDNILILATTSKLDFVDGSLRRPGRIDKEFEIYVPNPQMRRDILSKLLLKIPNVISDSEVQHISSVTHGFVGADLYGLCSQAIISAVKRLKKEKTILDSELKIAMDDINHALTVVKPSAMKEVLVEVPDVKWSDIGGQKDLKLKLRQAVEWPLRHPEVFLRMGIETPRGVLMFGPPGCSKTMIAKALATESKINFLNIKGPELFSKWVGESEKAVRDVFHKARQVAPSIIFIDEIDALGGERSTLPGGGGSNVQERVLAQLLMELDGITALGCVTLVAATNRPDRIDKALLRPGRLDRIIYVPLPDDQTRQEIFTIKLRKMPVSEDVNILALVILTKGYSGAEIQAVCHEAAMNALEEDLNATVITAENFKVALSIVTPRTPSSLIDVYENYVNKSH